MTDGSWQKRFGGLRSIGSGAVGDVFSAVDRECRQRNVALKVPHDPRLLRRLKHEFQSRDIGHPNLIEFFELNDNCIVMEWVEGAVSVDAWIARSSIDAASSAAATGTMDDTPGLVGVVDFSPKPRRRRLLDEDRLRDVLVQLVDALEWLHACGRIHRDLKTSNVLVDVTGRVVIVDFGLADIIGKVTNRFAGTPGYVAPELRTAGHVGPACDWYAVGALLLHCLTGMEPEMARRTAWRHGGPPWVADLVEQLLVEDPEKRGNGDTVLRAIGRQRARLHRPSTSVRLIGRVNEMGEIEKGYLRTGTVVVKVTGAPGIGKTALVEECCRRWERRPDQVIVLRGRFYERDRRPDRAMDTVWDALTEEWKRRCEKDSDGTLQRPSLHIAGRDVVAIDSRREGRRARIDMLQERLADLAKKLRVVVFIDDIQWADLDSLRVLEAIARAPVLLIVTERTVLHPAGRTLAWPQDDVCTWELDPLDQQDAERLAVECGVPADAAGALAERCGGNPFRIRWASRLGGPRWNVTNISDVLSQHVALLEAEAPGALLALRVLAIAGRPIPRDIVAVLARIAPHAWPQVVGTLRRDELVRITGPHGHDLDLDDLLRDALLEDIRPELLISLSRELAESVEHDEIGDHVWIADLWLKARDHVRARAVLENALAEESRDLPPGQVVSICDKLVPLTDDANRVLSLYERRAGALRAGGYERRAADELRKLGKVREAGEQYLRSGHVELGLDMLGQVLAAAGLDISLTPRSGLALYVRSEATLRVRGRTPHVRPQRSVRACDAALSATIGLSMVSPVLAAGLASSALVLAIEAADSGRCARAMAVRAGHLAAGGWRHGRAAEALLIEAQAIANRLEANDINALTAATAGVVAYLVGDFAKAKRLLGSARPILQLARTAIWERDTVAIFEAWTDFYLGRSRPLARRLPNLIAEADNHENLYVATSLRSGTLVSVPLIQGVASNIVRTEAQRAIDLWPNAESSPLRTLHQHWDDILGQAEIDLFDGDHAAALARIERVWRYRSFVTLEVRVVQVSYCEAWFCRGRAALGTAVATRNPVARAWALAKVRLAIRRLRNQAPWTRGLASLLAAGATAVRYDAFHPATVEHLEQAVVALDGADMKLHAAVARHRLGSIVGGSRGEALARNAQKYADAEDVHDLDHVARWLAPVRM